MSVLVLSIRQGAYQSPLRLDFYRKEWVRIIPLSKPAMCGHVQQSPCGSSPQARRWQSSLLRVQIGCALLLLSAGCADDASSFSENPSVAAIDSAASGVEVPLVALRKSETGHSIISVALANHGASPCAVAGAFVSDENGISLDSEIVRGSSSILLPGVNEVAVLRVDGDASAGTACLQLGSAGASRTVRISLRTADQAHWIDRAAFGTSGSEVVVYARVPFRIAMGDILSCTIDEAERRVDSVSCFAERDGNQLVSIRAILAEPISQARRVLVNIRLVNGHSLVGVSRACVSSFVGQTQYDTPLRIVECSRNGNRVRCSIYNESDYRKLPIQLDSVAIDGFDVTSACEIPAEGIPPDMHRYDVDERSIAFPLPENDSDTHLLEIEYRQVASSAVRALESDAGEPKKVKCRFRGVLGRCIGFDCDPYLPNCVCIHNGGLRPDISEDEIGKRAHAIARQAVDLPCYLQLDNGATSEDALRAASHCDFVVVSPPSTTRAEGKNAIDAAKSFYSQLWQARASFVASITPDAGVPYSPEDVLWNTLSALAEGSRGVLLRTTPHEESVIARSCGIAAEQLAAELRKLLPSLALSEKIDLATRINESGVRIGIICCGPDEVLAFAVNDWCTRASTQGYEAFYAVPRQHLEIELPLGGEWRNAICQDGLSGSRINSEITDDGWIKLALPAFAVGSVCLIRRAEFADAGPQFEDKSSEDTHEQRSVVVPVSSPFINLGAHEAGDTLNFEIPIRTRYDGTVPIAVKANSDSRSNPAEIRGPIRLIEGETETVLRGQLQVPTRPGRSVTRLTVSAENAPKTGFDVFVDIEARKSFYSEPKALDLGVLVGIHRAVVRDVMIRCEDGYEIRSVTDDSGHTSISLQPNGKAFRVEVVPGAYGAFSGNLMVELAHSTGSSGVRKVRVPYQGECVRQVAVDPAFVLILPGENQRRRLQLRHISRRELTITGVKSHAPWIAVDSYSREPLTTSFVDCSVLDTRRGGDASTLTIECRDGGGDRYSIDIPFKVGEHGKR